MQLGATAGPGRVGAWDGDWFGVQRLRAAEAQRFTGLCSRGTEVHRSVQQRHRGSQACAAEACADRAPPVHAERHTHTQSRVHSWHCAGMPPAAARPRPMPALGAL
eukprot:343220-Chlamydomonas_euryale.AAC.1